MAMKGTMNLLHISPTETKAQTLLEMLISIAILLLMVGFMYYAFKSGMDSYTIGDTRMQRYQNARGILDMMSREISTAVTNAAMTIYCIGRSDAFYFTGPLKQTGITDNLYRVGYWRKHEPTASPPVLNTLMRGFEGRETSHPHYTFNGLSNNQLAHCVKALHFYYYDGSTSWPWPDTWSDFNGTNVLPEAVRIMLTTQDKDAQAEAQTFSTTVRLPNAE